MSPFRIALLAGLLGSAAAVAWWGIGLRHQADEPPLLVPDAKAELFALGYVDEVERDSEPDQSGVVFHDPTRAAAGVNVYCSIHSSTVHFFDMDGAALHEIELPGPGRGADCMVEPYADGTFLVVTWPFITRITWDSEVLWRIEDNYHHDVAIGPDGSAFTLAEIPGELEGPEGVVPIRDHVIRVLSPDGVVQREFRLSKLLGSRVPMRRLRDIAEFQRAAEPDEPSLNHGRDVFHVNTVDVLRRNGPLGRAGDILICVRELDLVAVVSANGRRLRWSWGAGELENPHHPSVLPNGNLLIFDNGRRRERSRIVEVDPERRTIVWSYGSEPDERFYSKVRGAAQGLPGGNVLVTESTTGRVFEVTRDGAIVWDFRNPERTAAGKRGQIYRLVRLARSTLPQLEQR